MNGKIMEMKNKAKTFLQKNLIPIMFMVITILALIIRYELRDFASGDYDHFLSSWFNTIQQKGGMVALKENIGDYNIPYLVIMAILTYLPVNSLFSIKAVSIIFDLIGGLAVAKLVTMLTKEKETSKLMGLIAYAIFLFMPTVWLNSAAWAQCDIIYTTFILISLICLFKEKYTSSFELLLA